MIKKRTVLVLGAGASIPYGFPSGRQLLLDIVRSLGFENHDLIKALLTLNYPRAAIERFRDALANSMQPSVDAFLEKRREFLEVGKATIGDSASTR